MCITIMSDVFSLHVELAWCSGCVMNYAMPGGSIPVGDGVKPSFTSFARDSKLGRRL